ncbi:MAG: L,D-transpeptidase family protein [Polyangiaceae bacterium]
MGKLPIFAALVLFALGLQSHALGATRDAPAHADRIVIRKVDHTMQLFKGETSLALYSVALGPGGAGFKTHEGDKVTPVGRYHVLSRSPSVFHIFMRLDYPNADDRARFAKLKASGALDKNATIGGDVGIHGAPAQQEWKKVHKAFDWTLGCIAVDDDEIEKVAAMVPDGTIVDIEE